MSRPARPVLVRNYRRGLRIHVASIRRAIHILDASRQFPVPDGELSLVILDAAAMGRLHADFLDDPSPTDVITFDGDPVLNSAGEVCVCADVARDYAAGHGEDFPRELMLYLVHGYLHLAGFNDTRPALKRAMRAAEARAMRVLDDAGLPLGTIAAWR